MKYFPFTLLFNVPGLTNPFTSSAPAAASKTEAETESGRHRSSPKQSETKRLKRNFDASAQPHSPVPYQRHPKPSGSQSVRLVRKRGWQPSSPIQPSQAAVIKPSATGLFDFASEYRDMNGVNDKRKQDDDVELDLPPAKRRKGLAESVITTAFNAALVGAAVGLTVFRLWKDRGKEVEQSPPPPYQEDWAQPASVAAPEPETPPTAPRVQKAHATSSAHRRHGGSTRHRQKVVRRTVHIRHDAGSSRKSSPHLQQEEFAGHNSLSYGFTSPDDTLDEMDWIGERLTQLIEDGKRALGKEIVVASEAAEDEVDDGSGNWVEDEPEASASFASCQLIPPASPAKRSRIGETSSVPNSASPRPSSFPCHSRFHSDDLSASLQSTPKRPAIAAVSDSGAVSSFLSKTYETESPSIRESMEHARAAYLQKRGLGIDTQGTRY